MGKSQGEIKKEKRAEISRRNFLKNLGIGAGALALASLGGLEVLRRSAETARWIFLLET
jgi:hypothetical protein